MKKRSAGFTLIELLVGIAVSSTLLCLGLFWVQTTMRFYRHVQTQNRSNDALTQLGRDFRNDVERSADFRLSDEKKLELLSPHGKICYTIEPGKIIAIYENRDRTYQQAFRLEPLAQASFGLDNDDAGLVLRITKPVDGEGDGELVDRRNDVLFVVAYVGRWSGFEIREGFDRREKGGSESDN